MSCPFPLGDPNCQIEKWFVKGEYCLALFAIKNIEEGEEITFKYRFSFYNQNVDQKCECNSKNCLGSIGEKSRYDQFIGNSVFMTKIVQK